MQLTPNPDDYMTVQRSLRRRLLNQACVPWAAGRDLAAHLLLHLDDTQASWRCAVEWLGRSLACARADGGMATPADNVYSPGTWETCDTGAGVVSLKGVRVDNQHPAMQRLWSARRTLVSAEVSQEIRFPPQLRRDLSAAGTQRKLARALWSDHQPMGLICIDRAAGQSEWESSVYERFESACAEVLEPVLGAALRLHADARALVEGKDHAGRLTPAEKEVALLAREGLRYKQIAAQLGRSFSTVDHQLRSIRQKLGVKNHAALVRVLAHREFSR